MRGQTSSMWFSIAMVFSSAISAHAAPLLKGYPDLYRTPVLVSDLSTCPSDGDLLAQKTMLDRTGAPLIQVCAYVAEECAFNGSCLIEQPGQKILGFNFVAYNKKADRTAFAKIDMETCPAGYGYGREAAGKGLQTCLDPYFGVAANLNEHMVGEVIYIPKLVGHKLPTGEIHDGYVIVRDTATLLADAPAGVYSFFMGLTSDERPFDPFFLKNFKTSDHVFQYQMVKGAKAEEIRNKRNFPGLTEKARQNIIGGML